MSPQRRPNTAQSVGIVPKVGAHGRGQGQVLSGLAVVAGPGQGKAEPELGVVVGRAGLHDQPEVPGRLGVLAGVELRPGQGFQDAAGPWLSRCRPLQQLRGRGRTAPAEQVEAARVELVSVGIGRGLARLTAGISPAGIRPACRSF